jgi:hypothetical protein
MLKEPSCAADPCEQQTVRIESTRLIPGPITSIRHGAEGSLGDTFVASSLDSDSLESHLRQALGEMERRIHIGEDCRTEEFFATFPALAANVNTAIEMIYAEFAARREAGQKPARDDFYRRFPQWQAELRIQFEVDEKLGDDLPNVREVQITGPDGAPEIYHVLKEIWRSANGNVEKAINVRLNRIDAVKTLVNGDGADVARFRAGAREQARLRHDHILPVYLVGETDEGSPCFAMEFADGGSLARKIVGKPQPPSDAARLVQTLAEAIAYAHREGVVHRDLKPANVVLTADGAPKITDFGLVRRLDAVDGPSKTGDILGTPEYMAPEQAAGRTEIVGPLCDVYSLGAILYELLTGRPPFLGKTVVEVLNKVVKKAPVRPSRVVRDVPRGLESICLKCLEKNPKRRYRSAQELADDLGRWLDNQRPAAHGLIARTDRIVRRNRHVCMAAAVLLVFAVVTPVLAYALSPERVRERIERDLVAGKEVVLIDDKGPPKWRSWMTSDATQIDGIAEDGTYWVEVANFSLVELVRDPRVSCFRLSAELRHDKTEPRSGQVGLYFAYSKHSTERGLEHCFMSVALNGLTDERLFRRNQASNEGNEIKLSVGRLHDPSWGMRRSDPGNNAYVPVNDADKGLWRKIEVEVSSGMVRFSVWRDSKLVSEIRTGEANRHKIQISRKFVSVPAKQALTADTAVMEIEPEFAPRSPLGLYVLQGRASFRNVVITPLTNPN